MKAEWFEQPHGAAGDLLVVFKKSPPSRVAIAEPEAWNDEIGIWRSDRRVERLERFAPEGRLLEVIPGGVL